MEGGEARASGYESDTDEEEAEEAEMAEAEDPSMLVDSSERAPNDPKHGAACAGVRVFRPPPADADAAPVDGSWYKVADPVGDEWVANPTPQQRVRRRAK